MEKLVFGLTVALIGMMIVFFGLVILIGLIKTLGILSTPRKKKEKEVKTETPVVSTVPVEEKADNVQDDGAIVAAITAAISCILGEGNGFTVKHIRRIAK